MDLRRNAFAKPFDLTAVTSRCDGSEHVDVE